MSKEKEIIKELEKNEYVLNQKGEYSITDLQSDLTVDSIDGFNPMLFKDDIHLLTFAIEELFIHDGQPKRMAQSICKIFDFENIEVNFPNNLNDKEYCEYMLDFLTDLKIEISNQIKDYKYIVKSIKN